jgi:glycerol-3-phosphate acyltransferase PlsY
MNRSPTEFCGCAKRKHLPGEPQAREKPPHTAPKVPLSTAVREPVRDPMVLMLGYILAAVGGYLLGSIPFGLVLTRAAGLGDIRDIGSGNIGATNVLRTGRKDLALATLLLDAGKAAIALLLVRVIAGGENPHQTEFGLVAGAAAFLGHCFPVWLNFKGGKGVATFFGVLFAGIWPLGLVAGVTWLAVATIFRYSSLAALAAATATPLMALVAQFSWPEITFTAVLAALIFWRHSANIARLRAGTEPRIGEKRDGASEQSAAQQDEPIASEAQPVEIQDGEAQSPEPPSAAAAPSQSEPTQGA